MGGGLGDHRRRHGYQGAGSPALATVGCRGLCNRRSCVARRDNLASKKEVVAQRQRLAERLAAVAHRTTRMRLDDVRKNERHLEAAIASHDATIERTAAQTAGSSCPIRHSAIRSTPASFVCRASVASSSALATHISQSPDFAPRSVPDRGSRVSWTRALRGDALRVGVSRPRRLTSASRPPIAVQRQRGDDARRADLRDATAERRRAPNPASEIGPGADVDQCWSYSIGMHEVGDAGDRFARDTRPCPSRESRRRSCETPRACAESVIAFTTRSSAARSRALERLRSRAPGRRSASPPRDAAIAPAARASRASSRPSARIGAGMESVAVPRRDDRHALDAPRQRDASCRRRAAE